MPGVVRDFGIDIAGGPLLEGAADVYVEGAPVVRVGDMVAPHGRGVHSSANMIEGSINVYVNGIPVCRTGDIASCGHPATGSFTVFAN